MYLNPKTKKKQLFQPPQHDKYTLVHFVLAYFGALLLMAVLNAFMGEVFGLIFTSVAINMIGLTYDYGEATGHKSQEGIDPLDLLMNFLGAELGCATLLIMVNA